MSAPCGRSARTLRAWFARLNFAISKPVSPACWALAPTPGTGCSATRARPNFIRSASSGRDRATPSRLLATSCSISAPSGWTCASRWRRRSWRSSGMRSTAVDEVHGFRYFDDRDLLGFVDGTENPRGQAVIDAALIGAEDAAFAGGSYVITQKYLHDLCGMERAADRDAGAHHRPQEALGHRTRRFGQADLRA